MKKLIFISLLLMVRVFVGAQGAGTFVVNKDTIQLHQSVTTTPGEVLTTTNTTGVGVWKTIGTAGAWALTGNAINNNASILGITTPFDLNIAAWNKSQLILGNDSLTANVAHFQATDRSANGVYCDSASQQYYLGSDSNNVFFGYSAGQYVVSTQGDFYYFRSADGTADPLSINAVPNTTPLVHVYNANFQYQDVAATYGLNKVLRSDANGNATWISPSFFGVTGATGATGATGSNGATGATGATGGLSYAYDTLSNITTGTITLTNNANNVVVASGTITATTIAFPTGVDGNTLIINNTQSIATLTSVTGAGTGTITAARKAELLLSGTHLFTNIGGNWH